jgi:formate hydrogenlyase transcriptional activator
MIGSSSRKPSKDGGRPSGIRLHGRIVRPDGAIRHVRCVGIPLDQGGTLQDFVGTGIDVTEQEQLNEELRRRELELRQILDLATQLIAVFGPQRERLYLNRTALDYFGVSVDEWRNTQPGDVLHPDDTEQVQSLWDRAISSGSACEIEMRFRKSDASYRWFLARYNPVLDDQGQVLRWYASCTDIEDRKRAEESLQRENAALREELNQSSMFEEIVASSEPPRCQKSGREHHFGCITNRGLAPRPCRQMPNTARMLIDFRLGLRLHARN